MQCHSLQTYRGVSGGSMQPGQGIMILEVFSNLDSPVIL